MHKDKGTVITMHKRAPGITTMSLTLYPKTFSLCACDIYKVRVERVIEDKDKNTMDTAGLLHQRTHSCSSYLMCLMEAAEQPDDEGKICSLRVYTDFEIEDNKELRVFYEHRRILQGGDISPYECAFLT
ncbi:unnamed protein product [Allacma fusca]|uniref:Uncharacterized protein n=1 Tax=Allacma fusca TaxID=39272 RepID=A0A8J2KN76_9HEXA|nr:unnamed protein product [Allacma fusca]